MIASEAAKLLGAVSAFDGRPVTVEAAEMWASVLPDVALADALEAVRLYFTNHSGIGLERFMPVNVLDIVTEIHTNRRIQAYGDAMEWALAHGYSREEARANARRAVDQHLDKFPLADMESPVTARELLA